MLIEITSDQQLEKLLFTSGFLVSVNYLTKKVKLHMISCKFCDPKNSVGIKPSGKRLDKAGEFYYSKNPFEANSKAKEIAVKRGYAHSLCTFCSPSTVFTVCSSCGTKNNKGSNYCKKCGNKLTRQKG